MFNRVTMVKDQYVKPFNYVQIEQLMLETDI